MNHYTNKSLPIPTELSDANYVVIPGLKAALEVALELNMPLLLTGEPGTGKTRFAAHVANHFEELGAAYRFNAKTTSQAADLFYSYDALRHFHLVHNQLEADKGQELDLVDLQIIRFEALGEAIRVAMDTDGKRSVVLIDEIDKAPRDFPNDLLNVLEGGSISFKVPELGGQEFSVKPDKKPVVIITSNSEKSLPEAFLRRCIFYHIPFPEPTHLLEIVQQQLPASSVGYSEDELRALIRRFMHIRETLKKRSAKMPATAELISWLLILQKQDFRNTSLEQLTDEEKATLTQSFSIITKSKEAATALQKAFGLE